MEPAAPMHLFFLQPGLKLLQPAVFKKILAHNQSLDAEVSIRDPVLQNHFGLFLPSGSPTRINFISALSLVSCARFTAPP